MADPFGLVNRSLERNGHGRLGSGRKRTSRNPDNPADLEYLRAMHPDFDEVIISGQIDYRTRCQMDANFARSFRIPPVMEPVRAFREHSNSVDAVCWGPEPGSFLSASHDASLKLWDAESGRCTRTLSGQTGGLYHCAVSPNRKLIVACGSGETRNALVWQWPQGKVSLALDGHRRSVVHAAIAGDGAVTATVDQEGTLATHDLSRGTCTFRRTLHLGSAHGSSFCWQEPSLLCTAGHDGHVQLLDLRECSAPPVWLQASAAANYVSVQATLSIAAAHDGRAVHALEFASREALFTCGADHKLKRWDLRMLSPWSPTCAGEYLGHTAPVRALAVSPDLRFIVTGCEDGSCRLWPKDALEDTRASLRDLRAQRQQAGAQRDKLEAAIAEARRTEEQLAREGYNSAVRTLNGNTGLVSGCAWQEGATAGTASVLASSWDQSIQLFTLNLRELA
mmetsp:Transcript_101741/g.328307  ORF Transcript_101741/g.328307 Transcript_101741/m.328307 type:complete len:451 (-) Transcript_101741:5-1357(-)